MQAITFEATKSFTTALAMTGFVSQAWEKECSVRQGRNYTLAASFQGTMLFTVCMHINSLATEIFSRQAMVLLSLGTGVIGLGLAHAEPGSFDRSCLMALHDSLSTFAYSALVISTIVRCVMAKEVTAYMVGSLVGLEIGTLNRYRILPQKVRAWNEFFNTRAIQVMQVINGVLWTRFSVITDWVTTLLYTLHEKTIAIRDVENTPDIDPTTLQAWIQKLPTFELNTFHLKIPLPIPAVDRDLGMLLTIFEQVEWNERDLQILEQTVKKDALAKDFLEQDEEPLEFLRRGYTALVTQIRDEKIEHGEPGDYTRLKSYLSFMIEQMESGKLTKVDMQSYIMRLGIQGGYYCGPGKIEAVEALFFEMFSRCPTASIKDKLNLALVMDRRGRFQAFYRKINNLNPILSSVTEETDPNDIHKMNQMLALYGYAFGLGLENTDQDTTAEQGNPLSRIMMGIFVGSLSRPYMLGGSFVNPYAMPKEGEEVPEIESQIKTDPYDANFVRGKIGSDVGTHAITEETYVSWWNEWIKRNFKEGEEREIHLQSLPQGKLFGHSIYQSPFYEAVLVETGFIVEASSC